jgi:hypothetical protein
MKGTLEERIDVLMESAEKFKAIMLDDANKAAIETKRMVPREQVAAFNWEEIARVLREVREAPEGTKTDKKRKSDLLTKLSEVYEVLRAAKMSKLEAVRIALISESSHLQGSNAG